MIKKFDKTSIFILAAIGIFAIFALTLTVINVATALEEEASPEVTATNDEATNSTVITASNDASLNENVPNDNPANDPSVSISPNRTFGGGMYDFTIRISNFGDYNIFSNWKIGSSESKPILEGSPNCSMYTDPFEYKLYYCELGTGILGHLYCTIKNSSGNEIKIETFFSNSAITAEGVDLSINGSLTGTAIVGLNNDFHAGIDFTTVVPEGQYFYIKVRDPHGNTCYYNDNNPIPITSSSIQVAIDFTFMPHESGEWTVEAIVGQTENTLFKERAFWSKTFTVIDNPDPPGPGPQPGPDPDPPAPTPGGGGSEGTTTLASGTPQTSDSIAMILLSFSIIAASCAVVVWVVSRKRIIVVRPKH